MRKIITPFGKSIRKHIVVRIISICAATASLLIILQSIVIGSYVTAYQEKQALEDSYKILDASEEIFLNLYNNTKSYISQLYEEKPYRERIFSYIQKGSTRTPNDLIQLKNLMADRLKKKFADNSDTLIDAYFYDIEAQTLIPIHTEASNSEQPRFIKDAISRAEQELEHGPARQRIFEYLDSDDTLGRTTLTLFDFIRHPDNLTQIIGVMFFRFSNDKIDEEFEELGVSGGMEVMLVSQNGELCYDSFHNYSDSESLLSDIAMTPGVFKSDGIRVIRYNYRFGFYTISSIDDAALFGTVRKMRTLIVACTIVTLFLLVLLLSWYERHTAKRMYELADGIARIEAGRLDVVLKETKNGDEIDLLSHNLNEMEQRLASQIEQEKDSLSRAKQLELQQKDAEFYALQAQIKPHFLYNTLEAIRMRAIVEGAADTATMVRLLADVFRDHMSRKAVASISEMICACEHYAELLSYRFGNGLDIKIHSDVQTSDYIIPTYIIQPIVENALIHGLSKSMENPMLEISTVLEGKDILIRVHDNGCGMEPARLESLRYKLKEYRSVANGIGIANVNQRLKLFFGERYGLEIESVEGAGTTVTIRIPATTQKEWNGHV